MPWEKGGTSLLRPEGPREPGSVTCEMEGSRDLSGRNVFILPLPTQGIGLRPQPWARISRPVGPAEPATIRIKAIPNGGVTEDIITVNPILSQSSIQIRAAPAYPPAQRAGRL